MRMQATLDAVMIDWMLTELQNGGFTPETKAEQQIANDTIKELQAHKRFKELTVRANIVYENPAFMVFEHPDHGDEAPLMIFDKVLVRGWIETPFWDVQDPEEILEWIVKRTSRKRPDPRPWERRAICLGPGKASDLPRAGKGGVSA